MGVSRGMATKAADGPPRSASPLLHLDAVELAAQVRSGRLSARTAVQATLQRIAATNDELGAMVFVDEAGALARADAVDDSVAAGVDPGPLAGVPFGVKQLQAVRGWPWTLASGGLQGRVAPATATMVQRAVRAGAVPVGLTASPELGRASFTSSRLHGVTRNPWDLTRTPGGSSGGSAAAVSAGLMPICTGTDGAGSIRIPASFSGLVGFKGTRGRVTRGPLFGGSMQNDCYGVLTRSVRDTARFLDCVVGLDERDPDALPAPATAFEEALALPTTRKPLRVVWSETLGFAPCEPAVAAAARHAAETLLTALSAIEVRRPVALDDCSTTFRALSTPDVYQVLRALDRDDLTQLSPTVRQYLDPARGLHIDSLVDAYEERHRLVGTVAEIFDDADLIVTPTTQTTAFAAEGPMPSVINGVPVSHWASIGLTFPFNLTGHPAVSVPAGRCDGLPIGVQIVGRRHDDATVLAAAALLEQVQPWTKTAPDPDGRDR
ncbi:MAG TPA: amidase [Nocardioidaceae bacterium]|nr:amidase [Nocardioidaceae bacterium]